MRALVRAALLSSVAGSLMLAGCGSQEEPAGLDAPTENTAVPTTTPENDAPDSAPTTPDTAGNDDGTSTSGGNGGARTFKQPFLPKKSEVKLRDEVPIKVPDGATDAEAEVVEAFGRYYAQVEQILWGVPVEDVDLESVAAGERLAAIQDYAQESIEQERVTVGPPVSIHLLSVNADGGAAALDACIDTRDRMDVFGGDMPDPNDPLVRFDVELRKTDGSWLVTRSRLADKLGPCEGVFE